METLLFIERSNFIFSLKGHFVQRYSFFFIVDPLSRHISHRVLKVSRILFYFDIARRQCFYFDCVQLTIGWQGHTHVTLHMRGSTVQNQNKKKLYEKRDK